MATIGISARIVLVLALGQAFLHASGEVVTFERRPIPEPYSLEGLAAFTVYGPADGPTAQSGDGPFVEFRGVQAHSTDPRKADGDLKSYAGLQFVIIGVDEFQKNTSTVPPCGYNGQLSPTDAPMLIYNFGFNTSQFMHGAINKTGAYFLLLSNCGNVSLGEFSGHVAVRNPFGFMSGTQYHKLSFYGYSTLLYTVLALVWAVLCLTWRKELIAIHAVVAIVIGLKLLECVFWTVHLHSLNASGVASDITVCALVMFTTWTTFASYMFILVISQGWKMTVSKLDDCMLFKIAAVGIVWVSVNYLREEAVVNRQSFNISEKAMTMTAVASTASNAAVFVWILRSLARLSRILRERKLDDQLKAIRRFTAAITAAVGASALVALFQLMDSTGSVQVAWKYQYLADGGIPQVVFACVVAAAMCAWVPSAGSSQLGYSTAPVSQNDEDPPQDAEQNDGHKVAPATFGAPDDEDL